MADREATQLANAVRVADDDITPKVKNVFVSRVTATNMLNAGVLLGLKNSTIENVQLDTVRVSGRAGLPLRPWNCTFVQGKGVNVTPPVCLL